MSRRSPSTWPPRSAPRRSSQEHSTIGLVVTTDGTHQRHPPRGVRRGRGAGHPRTAGACNKPFAVLLNCERPSSRRGAGAGQNRCSSATACRCWRSTAWSMTEADIREILSNVLMEFPVKEIKVDLPRWILSLQKGHWLKTALYDAICNACAGRFAASTTSPNSCRRCESCEQIAHAQVTGMDLGNGKVMLSITVKPNLFYDILSEASGLAIGGEEGLLPCLMRAGRASSRSTTRSRARWRRWQPPAMAS